VADIANIAAGLMIEPLGDLIDGRLDRLTGDERFILTKILGAKPWYNRYRTINKLLMMPASTSNDSAALAPIEALRHDFDQSEIRNAAIARVFAGAITNGPGPDDAILDHA